MYTDREKENAKKTEQREKKNWTTVRTNAKCCAKRFWSVKTQFTYFNN